MELSLDITNAIKVNMGLSEKRVVRSSLENQLIVEGLTVDDKGIEPNPNRLCDGYNQTIE